MSRAVILSLISGVIVSIFWIWAMIHAARTPKATGWQKATWIVGLAFNPAASIWYWYIWKRWAFWLLFTPLLAFFASLPLLVRATLTHADATRMTRLLFAFGPRPLLIFFAVLIIFPLILRAAALFHIGKNTVLSAMDRNDWVISLALPVYGFGSGMAYCSKYRRPWAIAGFVWCILVSIMTWSVWTNVSQGILPYGEERREEFRAKINQ